MSAFRLLDVDTAAYYTTAALWIGVLFLMSEAFELIHGQTRGLKVAILIIAVFAVLEVMKRVAPTFHATFLRITTPGNTVLANWLSLMLFVHLITLPSSLAGVDAAAIIGWLATLVIQTILNLVFTAYLAAAA